MRSPRLRLDPGAEGDPIAPIEPTPLRSFKVGPEPLDDPFVKVENAIGLLEDARGSATQLAAHWVELGDLWWSRLGSLEEAIDFSDVPTISIFL